MPNHAMALVLLPVLLTASPCPAAPAVEVVLADGGRAALPVVTGPRATARVRKAATELADYLGRISGARFEVQAGDGTSGIAVGLAADFPLLAKRALPAAEGIAGREAYALRSHPAGLHVIGATEPAVEHAVWDLLHRLGYRQFFPGKTWEVVPSVASLKVAVAASERPDFFARRIWYGYGPWDYAAGPYAEWCARNRATSGMTLHTGHSYDGIISRNRKVFEAHPEYLALVDGRRRPAKFCISNPGLRRLVVDDALRWFGENPEADSISRDPSDGGGWCECDACKRMGSVSDRVLTLANETAEAVNRKYGDKRVGMYAYAYHSPPPGIRVHPKVVVSVARGFIRGGFTVEELIDGWSRQGAALGIREYYSVNTWDRDLPGRARGGNLDYLARTIPAFHAAGARFMSAESSDNWGPNGLGYYVASRILWDVDEAQHVERIVDDFLTRAFGRAKEPMAAFHGLLDGSRETLVVDDLLGRMYRRLDEARQLANSPAIVARIDDLVLYTRYVELYHAYAAADGAARQKAFETLIRHAYRMRKTMMVHAKALYRDLDARDKQVSIPEGAGWNVAEEKNPWKSSEPFGEAELRRLVSEGIAAHRLVELGFEPVGFSDKLVPAAKLKLAPVTPGEIGAGRGKQTFFTWVDEAPAAIELNITGGLIAHYRDRGNVRVELHHADDDRKHGGSSARPVASDRSVPPDGKTRAVRLPVGQPGLYRITISDGHDMTRVTWKAGTLVTLKSSLDEPLNLSGRWTLYFYVPRGTKVVGFHADGRGTIVDPEGREVLVLDGRKPGYHRVEVPSGSDGRLWKIDRASRTVRLMTVPPHLARSGRELLLPTKVVERDAPR